MTKGKGSIRIDKGRCKGCGLCISVCPRGGIVLADDIDNRGIRVASPVKSSRCNGCAFCYVICPDTAISVYKSTGGTNKQGEK